MRRPLASWVALLSACIAGPWCERAQRVALVRGDPPDDGTCAETTGSSATFYAFYLGSCDTCDDPPNARTWSVTGTR